MKQRKVTNRQEYCVARVLKVYFAAKGYYLAKLVLHEMPALEIVWHSPATRIDTTHRNTSVSANAFSFGDSQLILNIGLSLIEVVNLHRPKEVHSH